MVKKRDYVSVEYIWLDGNDPQQIRSKVRMVPSSKDDFSIIDAPNWSFDGSSTNQAQGHSSDLNLIPVRLYSTDHTFGLPKYLVLCGVYTQTGKPHPTNTRHILDQVHEKHKDQKVYLANKNT